MSPVDFIWTPHNSAKNCNYRGKNLQSANHSAKICKIYWSFIGLNIPMSVKQFSKSDRLRLQQSRDCKVTLSRAFFRTDKWLRFLPYGYINDQKRLPPLVLSSGLINDYGFCRMGIRIKNVYPPSCFLQDTANKRVWFLVWSG